MRNMIYLYLNFNPKAEYNSSWGFIAYVVLTLEANDHQNFCIFVHLLQNILANFFAKTENHYKKLEMITFFYLLAENKKFNFAKLLNPLADSPFGKKTTPPPMFQKIKKPSFKDFFSINKIFKTDSNTVLTAPPMIHEDCNVFPLHSENIKDLGLFYLVQSVIENWFGMLFTNILRLKDNLVLWDQLFMHGTDFLYQFGLACLSRMDSKLTNIIREEKERYSQMDIENPQIISLYIISSLKKALMLPLSHKEFQNVIHAANESTFEVLIREQRIKLYHQIQAIVQNLFSERLYNITQTKKEMNTFTVLSKQRIINILNDIDERPEANLNIDNLIAILNKNKIPKVDVAVKVFTLADFEFKGFLEKTEIKVFFMLMCNTTEAKLELLWREIGFNQFTLSPDQGIQILQLIQKFVYPDSIEIDEKISEIYAALTEEFSEEFAPLTHFIKFLYSCHYCNHLVKSLKTLDGSIPILKSKSKSISHMKAKTDYNEYAETDKLESIPSNVLDELAVDLRPGNIDLHEKTDSDTSLVSEGFTGREENADAKEGVKGGDIPAFTPNKLLSSAKKKIKTFARSLSINKTKGVPFNPALRIDFLSGRKTSSRGPNNDVILYHRTEAV